MSKDDEEIIDDDGNRILPPPANSDVAGVIYLLEYGRKRGFRIGPVVKIGETTVQVRDLRQERQMRDDGDAPDLEKGSDMSLLLTGE